MNVLGRHRLPPQPLPDDLKARIEGLNTAIEARRQNTKRALRTLVPKRSAIYVEGFDSSFPSPDQFTRYVDNAFRDALTVDLDSFVVILEHKLTTFKTRYDSMNALYQQLAKRIEEHQKWSEVWFSGANVENFATENPRTFSIDVQLDSEASLRASRSGRSVDDEFTRAMLRTPYSSTGAPSSPEETLQDYERALTELVIDMRNALPSGGGAGSSSSVSISSKHFLEYVGEVAHADDKLREYLIEDDVITLPMNALFDPYVESRTLLRLSWKREKDKLRRLLAQFETFAERYHKLFQQTERHRLLAELLRRGRVALEKKAKAEDAAHELEESGGFDGYFKAVVEKANEDYEIYVDRILHPFIKKVSEHPLTASEPALEYFKRGSNLPMTNLQEDALSVHARSYASLQGELRALGDTLVCSMNASQTMQLYAHMMVSMLTCMTLIASRSVRAELETSALIDEMLGSFSKSPELEEVNVLGVAATEIYKEKATLWGNKRWAETKRPTRRVEPANANVNAIVHSPVESAFRSGLARVRSTLARQRALRRSLDL